MKHIVFMVRNYYPYYSAVGICIGNVAEFLSEDHKVTVICEKTSFEELDLEVYEEQKILRFISESTSRRKKIKNLKESNNKLSQDLSDFLSLFNRTHEYIKFLSSANSSDKKLVDDYYKVLKEIEEPIDMIVPACMPFETMLAATKYADEHPELEIIPFLFDKFAESKTLHRTKWNKMLKMKNNLELEREVFTKSSKILFTPSWSEHLKENHINNNSKFRPVEHPLIKKIKSNKSNNYYDNKINIVYTGTVTIETRNPEPILKIFRKIFHVFPEIALHFYAMGNAVNIIKDYQIKSPENIIYHGQVSTEDAHSAILNSTILLSIGNKDITQTPSKIFEYISSGKPIIHVAVLENDPVINILSSYPKACCICLENETYENLQQRIKKFITESNFEKIDFAELEKKYFNATPRYSADKILI